MFSLFWLLPGAVGVFFFILAYMFSEKTSLRTEVANYTNRDVIYTTFTCILGVALGLFTLLFSVIVLTGEIYKWCSHNASIKNWLNKRPFSKD